MTDRGCGLPFEDAIEVDVRKLVRLRDAGELHCRSVSTRIRMAGGCRSVVASG
jgi:hypothetical protein